jgi:hypothetical protein
MVHYVDGKTYVRIAFNGVVVTGEEGAHIPGPGHIPYLYQLSKEAGTAGKRG